MSNILICFQMGKRESKVNLFVDRENGIKIGGCCKCGDVFGRTLFLPRTLSAASAFQLMNYSRAMYPAPVFSPRVCVCNANLSFLYVTGECHAECVCDSQIFPSAHLRITFIICVPARINAQPKWWKGMFLRVVIIAKCARRWCSFLYNI